MRQYKFYKYSLSTSKSILIEEQMKMNEIAGTWGSVSCFGSASTLYKGGYNNDRKM
ncbi:thiocillin family RiPP [Enterococcus sp. AZ126]|uniref:thiocillin family RiPP n=1 Tax=Enterococcus sp. AZ126 TaxID=2774635 RepID=UPI003F6847FC